ncbi:choice-of-anchor D domain-containing protein [candidate division WOR-3 bacterium]|nr:choice-of-anchor D domain-containing protein [candidate division WOR-3 bacterium]
MRKGFVIFAGMLSLWGMVFAGEITHTIYFSPADFSFSKIKGYDFITLSGCGHTNRIGEPMLPYINVSALIPPSATAKEVKIVSIESAEVHGTYKLFPAQPPRPISAETPLKFVKPKPEIYSLPIPYPKEKISNLHTGSMAGFRLASLDIYPVQYIPGEGTIRLFTRITFSLHYDEHSTQVKAIYKKKMDLFKETVRKMIINPGDIDIFSPPLLSHKGSKLLPADIVDYVIITPSTYESYFQKLVDWKEKKGLKKAKVVTTDWIYPNYTGIDNQEDIREFIKDADTTWGTSYFLLGGDTYVVPYRGCFGEVDTNFYPAPPYVIDSFIPCDLYFSDLDGNWDADGDGVYGEFIAQWSSSDDSVDMYPDVFIGRAPIENVGECTTFVEKVLRYEKNPSLTYQEGLLLPAEILWPGYPGDIVNDSIANLAPSSYQKSKLYETSGNLSDVAVMDSINSGFGFVHFAAHGGWSLISTGATYISNSEADNAANMNKLCVCNAICCWVGAMDYDCIVERFMNDPDGGSVAWIGNSRYGWGSGVLPAWSERIDIKMFYRLWHQGDYNIGKNLGNAKSAFIPGADQVWKWCIYDLNLFGCPEMPVWTRNPDSLSVTHSSIVSTGSSVFNVHVDSVITGGADVENAYVCLMCKSDTTVYARGYTNLSGDIGIPVSPGIAGDTMWITVTKHNFLPYEGYAIVSAGPDITVSPDTLEFEIILAKQTDTDTMWVDNVGTANLNVDSITTSTSWVDSIWPTNFTVFPRKTPVTVVTGIPVTVRVDTQGVSPGTYYGNLLIHSNDPDESIYYEFVKLTISEPDIAVSPDTLEFEIMLVKQTDTDTMWIKNMGAANLNVDSITTGISWVDSIGPTNFSLLPGDSELVIVTVDTQGVSPGTYYGNLLIYSNDPDGSIYCEPVKFVVTGTPDIAVLPDTLEFEIAKQTDTDTMWIKNMGSANLDVTNITKTQAWIISIDTTSFTVLPGDSQPVEVIVSGSGLTIGIYYDSLTITSNDPDESIYNEPVKFNYHPGVEEITEMVPKAVCLFESRPNPVFRYTEIKYGLPNRLWVSLKIYDLSGRLVSTPVNGYKEPGCHSVFLDTKDFMGGIYFYKLITKEETLTKKLILLK